MDETKFALSLKVQKNLIQAILTPVYASTLDNIKKSLDKSMQTIIKTIYTSLKLSIKRLKMAKKEEP